MRRAVLILLLVAVLSTWSGSALALPLIGAAIAGLFFTGTAAAIVGTIISVGIAVGISYVASTFLGKGEQQQEQQQAKDVGGVELDIRVDAEVPQQLIVGRAVTAGSLVYAATYGVRGEIDNSDLIEIIAIADHPCSVLREVYIEGEKAILRDSGTDRGLIVDGYTGVIGGTEAAIGEVLDQTFGKVFLWNPSAYLELVEQQVLQRKGDFLAVRFFDGTQTVADSFAVAKLSGQPQPWTSNHVGRGVTYVRTHSIYDKEKVPGRFRWKFVVDGIPLYDPRMDSTVGGSGAHRWMQPETYEWTDNPVVITYNVLRGIYVEGEIFYGLEGTTASQLPLDVWFAGMNECDVEVDRGDATTEKQYTCGAEISVATEVMETVRALLKTCGGRLSEIGGIYKIYVGSPGLPVASITDGALLANREDSFKPVLGLEKRINFLTGTYTNPFDGWLPKVAPPREILEWRQEDGRRLPADLQAPMVQSSTQMQRLMYQMLLRARQQRKHTVPLGPAAFQIEPGDIIEWDSDRNGYDDKLFEVDAVDYEPNLNVTLQVTEVDPDDYDWETDFELPEAEGRLITLLPAAKIIEGFDAEGVIYHGDLGTQRPAIKITWDAPVDRDLSTVRWQLRVFSDPSNVTSGSSDEPAAEALFIVGGLQPLTAYEVRARFESFNGWAAEWSLWIPVTTPDARLVAADFTEGLLEIARGNQREARAALAATKATIGRLLGELAAQTTDAAEKIVTEIRRTEGRVSAAYRQEITFAVGPDSALVGQLTALEARVTNEVGEAIASVQEEIQVLAAEVEGDLTSIATVLQTLSASIGEHSAQLSTRFIVGATPAGAIASYDLRATAENVTAGMRVVAIQEGATRLGYVYFDADRFYVGKEGVAGYTPFFTVDTANNRVLVNGTLIVPGTIDASKINVGQLSAITTQTGDLFVGAGQQVRILGSESRIEIWD